MVSYWHKAESFKGQNWIFVIKIQGLNFVAYWNNNKTIKEYTFTYFRIKIWFTA